MLIAAVVLGLMSAEALGAVAGGELQGSDDGCPIPGQIQSDASGWTSIRVPEFGRGSAWISAYAVDPRSPGAMFVTNGRAVMRSTDSGCTWSHAVPDIRSVYEAARVEAIVIPTHPAASGRVYLLVADRIVDDGSGETHTRPRILRSTEGGTPGSWTAIDEGLVPHGWPTDLITADDTPDLLYLAITLPLAAIMSDDSLGEVIDRIPEEARDQLPDTNATTILFVSQDAGDTWSLAVAESPGAARVSPQFTDVEVDPQDGGQLWGAGPTGLWRSDSGGSGWEKVLDAEKDPPTALVDVYHEPSEPARIWAFDSASNRSDDGGATWQKRTLRFGPLTSLAHGAERDHVLATVGEGKGGDAWGTAWGYQPVIQDWVALRNFDDVLRGASADLMPVPGFYAHTRYHIWRYRDPLWLLTPAVVDGGDRAAHPCANASSSGGSGLAARPTSLHPEHAEIELAPGEFQQVPYELELAKGSSRVDLFFLMDTSLSMGSAICGSARAAGEIAETLVEAGVDAWFGVGTYQHMERYRTTNAYPDCYAYRREHDIAPLTSGFVAALNRLSVCGGTEPEMSALHQAVTGTGVPPWISPNENANFRSNAIPVIVHLADEPRNETLLDQENAIQALRARGIYQVGVNFDRAYPWLKDVAVGTDTMANTPVDCGGDGMYEIRTGDPLVCTLGRAGVAQGKSLADAIANSVLGLSDVGSVRLLVADDPGGVVYDIAPQIYGDVRLWRADPLPFDVIYTCTPDQAGQTFPVELAAQVRSDVVATARALVRCLPIPHHPPPTDDALVHRGLAAAPPLIPPPPIPAGAPAPAPGPAPAPAPVPAPAPNPQPQSNPQTQTNPQSQPQAQAGLASQKQEQTQTALAQASHKIAEHEELAMSARPRRDPLSSLPIFAGGAFALGFGCVALARRRQEALAGRR